MQRSSRHLSGHEEGGIQDKSRKGEEGKGGREIRQRRLKEKGERRGRREMEVKESEGWWLKDSRRGWEE